MGSQGSQKWRGGGWITGLPPLAQVLLLVFPLSIPLQCPPASFSPLRPLVSLHLYSLLHSDPAPSATPPSFPRCFPYRHQFSLASFPSGCCPRADSCLWEPQPVYRAMAAASFGTDGWGLGSHVPRLEFWLFPLQVRRFSARGHGTGERFPRTRLGP